MVYRIHEHVDNSRPFLFNLRLGHRKRNHKLQNPKTIKKRNNRHRGARLHKKSSNRVFGQNPSNLEPVPIANANENRLPPRRPALDNLQLPFPSAPHRGLRELNLRNISRLPAPGAQPDRQTYRAQLNGDYASVCGQDADGRQLR